MPDDTRAARAPRGTLFLVVGPSGAGKDSLIEAARRAYAGDPRLSFARRIITRPAGSAGEDHIAVPEAAFERMAAAGRFALHWQAHGLRYGLPASLAGDLAGGVSVVANVSRAVLDPARDRFAPVRTILVTAPADVLAARLEGRGRETAADRAARLQRADELAVTGPDVTEIVNGGSLAAAVEAFLAVLGQAVPRSANRVSMQNGASGAG